jgi:hypothetical protein
VNRTGYPNLEQWSLARTFARELHEACPAELWNVPVRASRVAKYLGLSVRFVDDIAGRAELQFGTKISVRRGISRDAGRFAVAHEIAHAILIQRRPELVSTWSIPCQEAFANCFASELLMPFTSRPEFVRQLAAIASAQEIVRLASRYGFTATSLLKFASSDVGFFAGLPLVVLRVRYSVNRKTGRDPRFRIMSAYYDSTFAFVPVNQSVKSFAGSDDWLSALRPGHAVDGVDGTVQLSVHGDEEGRRWKRATIRARLSAFRYENAKDEEYAQFLVAARLPQESGARPASR